MNQHGRHYIHLFLSPSLSPPNRVLASNNSAIACISAAIQSLSVRLSTPTNSTSPLSLSLRIECRAVIALVHLSTTNFYSLSFLPSSVLLSGERTAAATPYIIQSDSRPVGCRGPPLFSRPPAKKTLRSIIVNFPPF